MAGHLRPAGGAVCVAVEEAEKRLRAEHLLDDLFDQGVADDLL